MIKKIFYISQLFVFVAAIYSSDESQTKAEIQGLAGKAIKALLEAGGSNQTIAIADFDNKSPKAQTNNMGHAVSEVLTERFKKSGKFILIENRQISKILSQLEIEQTGLYDSKKTSSVGNLVGAKFMIVGSVSELGTQFNISIRIVKIETGEVIVTESKEIPTETMNSVAALYKPAPYRVIIGAGFLTQKIGSQTINGSIEFNAGILYELATNHLLLFNITGSFFTTSSAPGFTTAVTPAIGAQSQYNAFLRRKSQINILLGYAYAFYPTQILSIKPYISAGMSIAAFDLNTALVEQQIKYQSPLVEGGVFITILDKNPFSFWISPGFTYAFKSLDYSDVGTRSAGGSTEISNISLTGSPLGFFIRGGLMLYI